MIRVGAHLNYLRRLFVKRQNSDFHSKIGKPQPFMQNPSRFEQYCHYRQPYKLDHLSRDSKMCWSSCTDTPQTCTVISSVEWAVLLLHYAAKDIYPFRALDWESTRISAGSPVDIGIPGFPHTERTIQALNLFPTAETFQKKGGQVLLGRTPNRHRMWDALEGEFQLSFTGGPAMSCAYHFHFLSNGICGMRHRRAVCSSGHESEKPVGIENPDPVAAAC